MNTTKQDFFKNEIESATSTKELFKVCNNLLNWTNENELPSHSCGTELANPFVNYFGDKIKSIHLDLEDSSNTPDYTISAANDFDGVQSIINQSIKSSFVKGAGTHPQNVPCRRRSHALRKAPVRRGRLLSTVLHR